MSRNKITEKMGFRFVQDVANVEQFQRESFGNQSQTYVFVDITVDGSLTNGQFIFGTDIKGNASASSVTMKVRTANLGGGIDFFNHSGTKIASLDANGNFKTTGSVTGNTTP